jgi:hypothetical protein
LAIFMARPGATGTGSEGAEHKEGGRSCQPRGVPPP